MPLAPQIADFYLRQGRMTDPAPLEGLLADAPKDPLGIAAFIQNLILHQHWAPAYRMRLSAERIEEAHTRRLSDMLALLARHDPRPLAHVRTLYQRMVGNCRHFSVFAVALLRRAGIPARARCGFAMYFQPEFGVDHWVAEFWNGTAWQLMDAQLDAAQRAMLRLEFDPLDLPRDQFIAAGEAWRRCRDGKADPDRFGILDMKGLWFVAGNLVRDVAALNALEMLPWDVWGTMMEPAEGPSAEKLALFDRLAAMTSDPDGHFSALRDIYCSGPHLRVPAEVLNAVRQRSEAV